MSDDAHGREIRMELLRPGQLNEERGRCPLVFVPLGPLEYHGPHLPVGTDPLNATQCALAACRRLGMGVVYPTLYWGTERERPGWMLESLGFSPEDWIVGMDFPSATWRSHYQPEHVFALVVGAVLETLIRDGYRLVFLVNGHGAQNHRETLERLALHYSHTTGARVVCRLAFTLDVSGELQAGHADLAETSLMQRYQRQAGDRDDIVDLGQLPERSVPIRYRDFSIVDSAGFSPHPSPGRVVQTDPRDATPQRGAAIFEAIVATLVRAASEALSEALAGRSPPG